MLAWSAWVCVACLPCVCFAAQQNASPQTFSYRETISAEVERLASAQTEALVDLYTLPVCKPPLITEPARIQTSPYAFTLLVEEVGKAACMGRGQEGSHSYGPLTDKEANDLKEVIRLQYRLPLSLDGLPMSVVSHRNAAEMEVPGLEMGFEANGTYYVNNHIMFKISLQIDGRTQISSADEFMNIDNSKLEVVEFYGFACSIKRDASRPIDKRLMCFEDRNDDLADQQPIETGASIIYTYDVFFESVNYSRAVAGTWRNHPLITRVQRAIAAVAASQPAAFLSYCAVALFTYAVLSLVRKRAAPSSA